MPRTSKTRRRSGRPIITTSTNTDIDVTPAEVRRHPWTLHYRSADFQRADGGLRSDAAGAGFEIELEQAWQGLGDQSNATLIPGTVYVQGWIAGVDNDAAPCNMIIDGGKVSMDRLAEFVAALAEVIRLARAAEAAQRAGGR
jgi:hypothetical protein